MFILPDARVFITQLTTFQCPLFFTGSGAHVRAEITALHPETGTINRTVCETFLSFGDGLWEEHGRCPSS